MINAPLSMRLAGIAILSLFVAGQINRGIYRLAWNPRAIGPWSKPHKDAPPRKWFDRIPFLGWFSLEREGKIHGNWFWIRPMLIEVAFPVAMCMLYVWEIGGGLRAGAVVGMPEIHAEYLSHYLIITLMTVATFIDFDEKTIPDAITIPGTLAGMALATFLPSSLLPDEAATLWFTAPNDWQVWLNGPQGLGVAITCFTGWCIALLPRTVWFRHGIVKGLRYLFASMCRHALSKLVALMWLAGCGFIIGIWFWQGRDVAGLGWQGLLSSLVGIAGGGALVWAIRIAASAALGREALGFGDVTLMAMIGSFFGWQFSTLAFFAAPFAGAIIAVAQVVVTRNREIAFGPFICAGTLAVLLWWDPLWLRWGPVFALGWIIPGVLIACILLMAVMLVIWRMITGLRGHG